MLKNYKTENFLPNFIRKTFPKPWFYCIYRSQVVAEIWRDSLPSLNLSTSRHINRFYFLQFFGELKWSNFVKNTFGNSIQCWICEFFIELFWPPERFAVSNFCLHLCKILFYLIQHLVKFFWKVMIEISFSCQKFIFVNAYLRRIFTMIKNKDHY